MENENLIVLTPDFTARDGAQTPMPSEFGEIGNIRAKMEGFVEINFFF
jgi:hypothetical protein